MNEELKKAMDEVQSTVVAMREANDKALAQKADKGYVEAELQAKVDKLNANITAAMDKMVARMDDVERKYNEAQIAEPKTQSELKDICAQFGAMVSKRRPERIANPVSMDEFKAYCSAFKAYLKTGEIRAGMEIGSDPAGGYLVTPTVGNMIIKLVQESSPMRELCSVLPIDGDAYEDLLDLNKMTASWVGEKRTVAATAAPQLGALRIPLCEQQVMPEATQRMLNQRADVEGWLAGKVAEAFSLGENESFLNGDTPVEPLGIIGGRTPTSAAVTAAAWNHVRYYPTGASGAFHASIPGDYLIDQVFGLKAAYRQNARWLMGRLTIAAIRKLKDGDNNYLWQPDFSVARAGSLLGYPISEGEDMPAIGSASYSIAFGDFKKAYLIVDGVGTRVLRDPYTNKPNVRFYTTRFVGGDVVNFEAINLTKFAAS